MALVLRLLARRLKLGRGLLHVLHGQLAVREQVHGAGRRAVDGDHVLHLVPVHDVAARQRRAQRLAQCEDVGCELERGAGLLRPQA